MKLPLIAVVLGLLLGIALTVVVAPETPQGSAFLIIVATLVITIVVLGVGRFWPKRPDPPGPGPAHE